jgi:hypothetical protein
MAPESTFPSLLNAADRELLRAATRPEAEAVAAFARWQALVPFDDIESSVRLALPRLLDLASRNGGGDRDLGRMKGLNRYIWTSNVVRLRQLFAALAALDRTGTPALVLKGAAIFARDPSAATGRVTGDYDILVKPETIEAARAALAAAGFEPEEMEWSDVDQAVVDCPTPGTPIATPGVPGDIDLHWRPLPGVFDRFLTARLFSGAEKASLMGHAVAIPCAAHHLFLAIARCESWDSNECVGRLLEGRLLLAVAGESLDWRELSFLLGRYRLWPLAAAYFAALHENCGVDPPPAAASALAPMNGALPGREWRLRLTPPPLRNPLHLRALAAIDRRSRRAPHGAAAPGLVEAALRQYGAGEMSMKLLWRLARGRMRGGASGAPRFLEGFSYPERDGRWTDGRWALLTIPLSEAERRGAPVWFNGHAFLAGGESTKIVVCAGRQPVVWTPLQPDGVTGFAVSCRGVDRLGGDALVLIFLPEATSPLRAGLSKDRRQLGLFIRRAWRLGAPGEIADANASQTSAHSNAASA